MEAGHRSVTEALEEEAWAEEQDQEESQGYWRVPCMGTEVQREVE